MGQRGIFRLYRPSVPGISRLRDTKTSQTFLRQTPHSFPLLATSQGVRCPECSIFPSAHATKHRVKPNDLVVLRLADFALFESCISHRRHIAKLQSQLIDTTITDLRQITHLVIWTHRQMPEGVDQQRHEIDHITIPNYPGLAIRPTRDTPIRIRTMMSTTWVPSYHPPG